MEDFIPTRGSKLRKDVGKEFTAVNFEARKKKVVKNADTSDEKNKLLNTEYHSANNRKEKDIDPKRQQELEMKRIRYEIMKFGMAGFEKAKAKKAKVALAISLGAKPDKNRRMNYKKLKTKRLRQNEAKKKAEPVSGLDRSLMKHKPKKIHKKDSDGILGVYGKVGKAGMTKKKN